MTGLPELVARFRPVTPDCEDVLSDYAATFYHRPAQLPRFFFSPTYLAAQPSVFWWGEIDGCLCVLKRRYIVGNPVMYLVLPPVSRIGDVRSERNLIERFRQYGVSTMLDPADRARYGYTEREAKPDPRWPEYHYGSEVHAPPVGGSHKNTRAALNLFRRLRGEGRIHAYQGAYVPPGGLEQLARTWHEQTNRHRGEVRLVRTFADHALRGPLRRWAVTIADGDGKPIAHSLTEEVTPGQVVIVSRLRDYADTTLPDPTLTVHVLDCLYWQHVTPGAMLTSGSAGTPGLTGHKAKLRPIAVVPLGRLDTGRRITKEEYAAAVPGAALNPQQNLESL